MGALGLTSWTLLTIFGLILLTTALALDQRQGFKKAMVASDAQVCSEAGRDILLKKGSAVDAALATLLCLGVVIPESMGIGGGFLMTIYSKKKGLVEVLDAREVAPIKSNRTMFAENPQAAIHGSLAVAVPGLVRGMEEAHRKYGVLKWNELFKPAIDLSKNGYEVCEHMELSINRTKDEVVKFKPLRDLLWNADKNRFYREGDFMKNPKLSKTLSELARDGPETYYTGNMGERLVRDIQEANGIITEQDLKLYQPRWRKPVQQKMPGSLTLNTFPLPGSGAVLSFILNVMKGYNPKPKTTTEEKILYYHQVIETLKFAYARRMGLEDNDQSPPVKQLVKLMSSENYAESIRQKISDDETYYDYLRYEMPNQLFSNYLVKDQGTSHLSVVAENGDAVSVTSTINRYFGSLVMSPSTGIILNDQMDDFSKPTDENNNAGRTANQIYPGRRPLSSMVPSIFVDHKGNVKLAIGASGGTRITSSVAMVCMSNLWLGKNISTAISEPRLHDQFLPIETDIESRLPQEIRDGLSEIGHLIKDVDKVMSGVVGIAREKDGLLYGAADIRRGGGVAGY